MNTVRTLAMDTAFAPGGVALLEDDRLLGHALLDDGRPHLVTLPLAVGGLLERAGLQVSDLSLLAVTIGPGSFTGLRIGLGLAKGMALARRLPLLGVSTLEAWAAASGVERGLVLSVMDAKREEVAAALYRVSAGALPEVVVPPRLWRPEAVPAWLTACRGDAPLFLAGQAGEAWEGRLLTMIPGLRPAPRRVAASEPETVARLALARYRAGAEGQPAGVEPFYLRPSDAEAKRRERELSP